MLSAKPWRTDALIRLFASVLVCVLFLSTIATSAVLFFSRTGHHHSIEILALIAGTFLCLVGALLVLRRAWPYEKFIRNFAILMACVYGGFLLMWLLAKSQPDEVALNNSTARIVIAVLSFQGAALVLAHFFLREHRVNWREGFGLGNRPANALLIGVAMGLCAVPIGWGLQMSSGLLMDYFHVPTREQEAITILRTSATGLSRLMLGVTAIVLAPLAEEILFRGIMYPAIKHAGFPRLALWLSALLFGAIHANLATFLPLTLFALALVWLYERTDNLLAPIIAHSLFNTVNFVMLFTAEFFQKLPMPK